MRTKVKKLTSVILAVVMMLGILTIAPLTVSAATYGDFEYTLEDDYTCMITKYNGSAANVTIPAKIDGYTVTKIDDDAFHCENIEEINIPNNVVEIGNYAFYECNKLKNVNFMANSRLKRIGNAAFYSCEKIDGVSLPDNVTEIGDMAFYKCINLRLVNSKLPSKLTRIDDNAFSWCENIKEVYIPDSVNEIGKRAFDNCKNLNSIFVNANNKNYCSVNNVLYNKNITELVAYSLMSRTTDFKIPDTVIKVSTSMENTKYLKSITIPKSVTEFPYCGFGMTGEQLENIFVDKANSTFYSKNGILYDNSNMVIAYPQNNKTKTFELTGAGNEMGFTLLRNCNYVENLVVPSNITNFVVGGLCYAPSLKNIYVDKSNPTYCDINGVLYSKNKKTLIHYPKGRTETTYKFPEIVSSIRRAAFYDCKNLKTITIPDNIKNLNGMDFFSCDNLKDITFSKEIKNIGIGLGYHNEDNPFQGDGKHITPLKGVTIKGYKGTIAETYAKNGGFKFVDLSNLPTPSISSLSNTTGGIKISWNKVDGTYGYRLYYKPASGGWKRFKDTTATSFTDSGVVPNKTETYTIRCIDKNGNTISGFNSTGWSKKYTPAAPTVSKLDITTGGIKLSWNKIAGVYGYRLYQKTSNGWKRIKDTTATSYTDSAVSANQTKIYTIRCIDKNGKTVSGFNSKGWSKKYTPVAPTISKLENTSGGIKISWNKIAGVYGYRLYQKTSNGWKRIKDTTATSFTDSAVSANQTKTYTIRCIDKNGKTVSGFNSKGWSKKYTAATPKITKLTNTSKGVSVTWNKIAGVYGYRLYRKYDGGSWTKVKDITSTSFTDSGAKKGKKVTYTVRCIDRKGKTVSGFNSKGWSITRR